MSMLGHYASFDKGEKYTNQYGEELINTETIIGLFERHDLKPTGALHVGAHECPERACYTKLFNTNVIWVEANPETYENLTLPVAEADGQQAFNFAAHLEDFKEVVLFCPTARADMSSLKEMEGVDLKVQTIKTQRLDTFLTRLNGLGNPEALENIDFLNIDVEGLELEVIEGLGDWIDHFDSIFIEVTVDSIQKIVEHIVPRGFALAELSKSIEHLGWGDAFFIRRP